MKKISYTLNILFILHLVGSSLFGSYYEAMWSYARQFTHQSVTSIASTIAPSSELANRPDMPAEIITQGVTSILKEQEPKEEIQEIVIEEKTRIEILTSEIEVTEPEQIDVEIDLELDENSENDNAQKDDSLDTAEKENTSLQDESLIKDQDNEKEKEEKLEEKIEQKVEIKEQVPPREFIRGEDHPRALASLFNKDFDGSDFTLVEELKPSSHARNYSISYTGDGLLLSGTLHVPKNSPGKPFPLLVLNRGFYPTLVYSNGFGFSYEQEYFARRGYASLHLDFRGYGFSENGEDYINGRGLNYQNYVIDMINAVKAVKKANLPSIDTERIGLFGLSMGGGIVTNSIIAQPDIADAALVWGPVSSNYYDNYMKWEHKRLSDDDKFLLAKHFGPLNDPKSFRALSARPYLDRIKIPFEIQQGLEDKDTPYEWSDATVAELEALNKTYLYRQYPGEPHIFIGRSWSRAMGNAILHFDKYLQPDDFIREDLY